MTHNIFNDARGNKPDYFIQRQGYYPIGSHIVKAAHIKSFMYNQDRSHQKEYSQYPQLLIVAHQVLKYNTAFTMQSHGLY